MQRHDVSSGIIASAARADLSPNAQPVPCTPPCYTSTPAEIAAGVTPTDFSQLPRNVLRYGAVGNGSTDDTTAFANALRIINFGSNTPVVFPQGYVFKITSYVEIFSNTAIFWFGNVQLTNRNAGFFSNGGGNIAVYGFKTGQVIDPSVNAAYDWNHQSGSNTRVAPAIHMRSCTNVVIDGLTMNFVCQGILLSNATANTAVGAQWDLSQA